MNLSDAILEELVRLTPYLFGYLIIFSMRFSGPIVRHLVLPHEERNRQVALEIRCLYASSTAALASLSLSSWVVASAKIVALLFVDPKPMLGALMLFASLGFAWLGWVTFRFIQSLRPDDFNSKVKGKVGIVLRNSTRVRLLQAINITAGLLVDEFTRLV